MRALVAAMLLASLAACGSGGVDPAAPRPAAGKPLPFAPPPPPMPEEGIVCAADVGECPDGSFISRNPVKGCAFDACPGANTP
ncbi:MAG: hypothetical protein M1449_04030 [Candidatus Thermoplasmatota archaeon]|nr:hypothetical protein [Candidatus Thermoplasmatota archaeon]